DVYKRQVYYGPLSNAGFFSLKEKARRSEPATVDSNFERAVVPGASRWLVTSNQSHRHIHRNINWVTPPHRGSTLSTTIVKNLSEI
ncbi:hypothetical protein, partial [Klebsiella pneumoniae]|uniref:hypothetical protein n=1 Tax=Klebsiella pneumoniae TaxID=573 RepID=UPI002552689D